MKRYLLIEVEFYDFNYSVSNVFVRKCSLNEHKILHQYIQTENQYDNRSTFFIFDRDSIYKKLRPDIPTNFFHLHILIAQFMN